MSGQDPDPDSKRPTWLGIYDRPGRPSVSGIEIAAAALSLIWLVVAVAFLVLPEQTQAGSFIVMLLAVFMPVAMIWVAALAMRASRIMREESARLQTAIDAIRQAYVSQQQRAASTYEPAVARKLDEIAAAARHTQSTLATFSSKRRDLAPLARPAAPSGQTSSKRERHACRISPCAFSSRASNPLASCIVAKIRPSALRASSCTRTPPPPSGFGRSAKSSWMKRSWKARAASLASASQS